MAAKAKSRAQHSHTNPRVHSADKWACLNCFDERDRGREGCRGYGHTLAPAALFYPRVFFLRLEEDDGSAPGGAGRRPDPAGSRDSTSLSPVLFFLFSSVAGSQLFVLGLKNTGKSSNRP